MREYMKCPKCNGKGEIENPVHVGALFKKGRLIKGLSLRALAQRIKLSPAYVSDLEHGKRNWSQKIKTKYYEGLK